jgi:hypothetical protein
MTLQIWHGVDVEHTPKIFVSTSKAPLNPSVSIGWKDSRTAPHTHSRVQRQPPPCRPPPRRSTAPCGSASWAAPPSRSRSRAPCCSHPAPPSQPLAAAPRRRPGASPPTTAYPETASAHGSYEALLDDPAGRRRRVRPAPHQPPRALGHRRRSAWQVPAAREAHRALQRRPRRHPRRLRCRRRTVHGLYYMDASPAYRQDAGVRRQDAIGDIKLVSFLEQRLR